MADDQNAASTERWRGAALDVRGPGGGRRGAGGLPLQQPAGDRGDLRILDGVLAFAGERGAWSVPLGWLGDPETDLAGVTEIRIRTADRTRPIRLRLAGGALAVRALGQAIAAGRLDPPDARDRCALDELLTLLRPELETLGLFWPAARAAAGMPTPGEYAAAAARVEALWLPCWGAPASRLRAVTSGALLTVAEATQVDADAAAQVRCEEATRRWRSVVADLREWCGLTEAELPEAHWPAAQGESSAAAAAAGAPSPQTAPEPLAPTSSPPTPVAARGEAPPVVASQPQPPPQAPPVAASQMPPAVEPAAPSPPPSREPREERQQREQREQREADEDEGQGTVIIPARHLAPPPSSPPPAAEPPEGSTLVMTTPGPRPPLGAMPGPAPMQPPASPVPAPAAQAVNDAEAYDDRTLVAGRGRFAEETTPPLQTDYSAGRPATPQPTAPMTPAPPPAPPTPVAPAAVGPGRRGSGGMTLLFRQGGPGSAGAIARKVLQPDDAAKPDVVETFLGIGRRFAAVQQANFVRIINIGREQNSGLPYIDMEFIEGEGISARYGRGPAPAAQALEIVDQLAGAIEAVHRAGLVHGDVRPQNVLVEPGGRVVLLDPSVACDHVLEYRRGTVYGDLSYLTPERARGDAQGAPADIYMLATFAYALLAGRPPFVFSGDPTAIFAGHAEQPPPALDAVLTGAPPTAAAVLNRALAKLVEERPLSALAFAADLRRAFSASPFASRPQAGAGSTQPAGWSGQQTPSAPFPELTVLGTSLPSPQQAAPPSPAPPQRGGASPLGGRGASPLGGARPAASPLGRPAPPPTPPPARGDEPPDDDMDKTVIVRPR